MNSAIETIMLGVIANGLTAVIAQTAHLGRKLLLGEETNQKQSDLQSILQGAIEDTTESLEKWDAPCSGPLNLDRF